MPRPTRVHLPGALSLVTSEAAEGAVLFRDERDYATYLEFLADYRDRMQGVVHAYALLPTRLYLLVEPTAEHSISEMMHALQTRYTKYAAKRHGHTGHLFHGRFRTTLLERAPSLLWCTAFVHRLPARLGIGEDATYRWSSLPAYVAGGGSAGGVIRAPEVDRVTGLLAETFPGMSYESYVLGLTAAQLDSYEAALQAPMVGSAAFMASVRRRAAGASRHPGLEPGVERASRAGGAHQRVAMAGTVAVVVASLTAAGIYAKSIQVLERTLQVVTPRAEHAPAVVRGSVSGAESPAGRSASFHPPVVLAGTVWDVEIRPSGSAAGNAQADRIVFDEHQMRSQALQAQGFSVTNYSITDATSGMVVWETMQTGPRGEQVCWRGESDGRVMRGVLTRQAAGQPASTFEFAGVMRADGPRRAI